MKNASTTTWVVIGIAAVVVIILIIYLIKKPSTVVAPVTPAASTSLWSSLVNGATAIVGDFTKGSNSTNNSNNVQSSGTFASTAATANTPTAIAADNASGCPSGYWVGQGCIGTDPNGTSDTNDTCGFMCP